MKTYKCKNKKEFLKIIKRSKHKHGAEKIIVNGITFHSKKESQRYLELKFLEKKGLIRNLRRQVEYELIPAIYHNKCRQTCEFPASNVCDYTFHKLREKDWVCIQRAITYVADFVYEERPEYKGKIELCNWVEIVEDVKGFHTKEYKKKRKLMKQIWNIDIRES